jgi:hypothetical protein
LQLQYRSRASPAAIGSGAEPDVIGMSGQGWDMEIAVATARLARCTVRRAWCRRAAARAAIALLALSLAGGAARAEPAAESAAAPIGLELNKAEPQTDGCRLYLVLTNGDAEGYQAFKLDFVLFDTQGVILRRLAVEAAPLRADKRTVKLFDVRDVPCGEIGMVLVNEILECQTSAGPAEDCVSRLAVSSRAGIELVK